MGDTVDSKYIGYLDGDDGVLAVPETVQKPTTFNPNNPFNINWEAFLKKVEVPLFNAIASKPTEAPSLKPALLTANPADVNNPLMYNDFGQAVVALFKDRFAAGKGVRGRRLKNFQKEWEANQRLRDSEARWLAMSYTPRTHELIAAAAQAEAAKDPKYQAAVLQIQLLLQPSYLQTNGLDLSGDNAVENVLKWLNSKFNAGLVEDNLYGNKTRDALNQVLKNNVFTKEERDMLAAFQNRRLVGNKPVAKLDDEESAYSKAKRLGDMSSLITTKENVSDTEQEKIPQKETTEEVPQEGSNGGGLFNFNNFIAGLGDVAEKSISSYWNNNLIGRLYRGFLIGPEETKTTALFYKKGGPIQQFKERKMNKYQQGGAAPQDQTQQIVQLVQAAMAGDLKASQMIEQVQQAAQQGDQLATQLLQMILKIAQQLSRKAKYGAKLEYLDYLKKGGCTKMQKGKELKLNPDGTYPKHWTPDDRTAYEREHGELDEGAHYSPDPVKYKEVEKKEKKVQKKQVKKQVKKNESGTKLKPKGSKPAKPADKPKSDKPTLLKKCGGKTRKAFGGMLFPKYSNDTVPANRGLEIPNTMDYGGEGVSANRLIQKGYNEMKKKLMQKYQAGWRPTQQEVDGYTSQAGQQKLVDRPALAYEDSANSVERVDGYNRGFTPDMVNGAKGVGAGNAIINFFSQYKKQ